MDGFTNSKIEKELIYEIYRACRLCGAGAGYKMPIIQNVVDLDSGEVELKQKVRECVQIEVHQDDKMPPLICELCVDKVNDFYEFLEMCRQTNKRTRLRLGLPPQMLPRGAPDAGDCILGVTEPIFIDNEDSNEPILKSKGKTVKPVKVNREPENRDSKPKVVPKKDVKEGGKDRHEPRSLRRGAPSPPPPSPPRLLRGAKRSHEDDNVSLSSLKKSRKSDEPAPTKPRSILKTHRESKSEERAKITRLREKENEKIVNEKANAKKVVKIMVKKENFKAPYRAASPKPPEHKCKVCSAVYDTGLALSNHMRAHAKQKPVEQKPSTKRHECRRCCKQFLSRNLMEIHRCSGRPVPVKSNKPVTEVKPEPKPERPISKPKPERPVLKPQRAVTPKVSKPKRAEAPIDPELLKQLRPLQVRISRCDPLLENRLGDHYDASDVDYDYGLDKTCVYPYIYTFRHMRIKSEPLYMVSIQDEFKSALDRDDSYVHWDSDETDSDLDLSDTKNVDTLTSISLKTLFSKKLLGKVPKKRKKVKVEKAFDSILNSTSDFDSDMRLGIDNIISSLGDDNDKSLLDSSGAAKVDKNDDNDSLFGDDNSPAIAVTNDDFDSLFGGGATKTDDTNKITKSDASNINSFSMDFDEFDGKDCKNDSNAVQERKEFNKSDDSLNENDISDAKNVKDDIDSVKASNTEIDKSDSKEDDTEKSIGDNDTNKNDSKEEDTEKPSDDNDTNKRDNSSTDNKENSDDKNNHTLGVKTSSEGKDDSKTDENPESGELKAGKDKDKANNDGAHVNGQTDLAQEFNMDDLEDVSESEMEDSSLMEALDAQIDEKGTANAKIASERDRTVAEDSVPASGKSADLESISDGEFE